MANVPQLIKIGISLKMLPNDTAVYFKSDGARFGQTRTIKLLTGSKYRIEVVVKPGAVEATAMSVGGVTFPLEQKSKDPQSVVYTGQYDTEGVTHTKSGERQPVQINVQTGSGRNERKVSLDAPVLLRRQTAEGNSNCATPAAPCSQRQDHLKLCGR
ncbi:CB1 cannabinoid receptor-interacting protein 1b isoform X2 [Labrus mixtus]|uniref:CB1 cannabinoid receptor-interacting protein 1b isoform X2 n=1 Tax=Labrus mixtus TaxID=508554 RepID=UPI0029C06B41|nr:CB1 cannabinoid receptor-interacting protein 1b isoform X2 [Labrus mixtus]